MAALRTPGASFEGAAPAARADLSQAAENAVLWAARLALLPVAALGRLSPMPDVFVGKEVVPVEHDAFYHLDRTLRTLAHFPHAPIRDPFINWPHGADCAWAPGYDQLGALVAILAGARHDPLLAAKIVALVPAALGLLVVVGTVVLARAILKRDPAREAIAVAAGWVIALLPQAVAVSVVGRIDHHVAEALFVILLAVWVLGRVEAPEHTAGRLRRGLLREASGAAIVVAAVHVFSGSVMYVAIAAGTLVGLALGQRGAARPLRGLVGSGAPALAISAALLTLLAVPQVREHGRVYSHMYPSFVQPGLVGLGAVAIGASSLASSWVRPGGAGLGTALVRLSALVVPSVAVLGLLAALLPAARHEIVSGLVDWLAKRDPYMASIDETKPLFLGMSPLEPEAWSRIRSYFGAFGVAAPVALPLGLWRILRSERVRGACYAAFTLWLLVLTLVQSRFGRELVVMMAIWTAAAVGAACELATRALSRLGAVPTLLPGALVAVAPAFGMLDPGIRKLFVPRTSQGLAALPAAALSLRTRAPVVQGKGAGVLARWDMGFEIQRLAGRPVVVSGFGPYLSQEAYDVVDRAWRGTEAELSALMTARDLGFVVAGAATYTNVSSQSSRSPFKKNAQGRGVMDAAYFRSLPLSPLIVGGSGVPSIDVQHLRELMPRFASRQTVGGLDAPIPRLWAYERVPGALVVGPTEGPHRVVARIDLELGARKIEWIAWTLPREGRFELRIPVPTGATMGNIRTPAFFRLKRGDAPPIELAVPESAVRQGATIEVP